MVVEGELYLRHFPLPSRVPVSPKLPTHYDLYLFVAGNAPRGTAALRNAQTICAEHLAGRHTLTVVDVQTDPGRAIEEGLLGLPCLVKKGPGAVRRLVGDLSNCSRVLKLLEIG